MPSKEKSVLVRAYMFPFGSERSKANATLPHNSLHRTHNYCRYQYTSIRTTTDDTFLSIIFVKDDQCFTLSNTFKASKTRIGTGEPIIVVSNNIFQLRNTVFRDVSLLKTEFIVIVNGCKTFGFSIFVRLNSTNITASTFVTVMDLKNV